MTKAVADVLNLPLAWKRMKQDIKNRNFIVHPFEIDLIELDLSTWLRDLQNDIANDRYNPSPLYICDVPKGKGTIRPGAHLTITDRVVYSACVGACHSYIYKAVNWSTEKVNFSYRLNDDERSPEWMRSTFIGWRDFGNESVKRIDEGSYTHVILSDVSGYYENIDIQTVISDLRGTGAPNEVINLLSRCLNRWAQSIGRSLPQGQTPSDILAKLYFAPIDRNLRSMGHFHYRYVDDIRIFCRSRAEAKRALMDFIRLLRNRGLCVQSAKSKICPAEAAKNEIEGARPVIRRLNKNFTGTMPEMFHMHTPYTVRDDPKSRLVSPKHENTNDDDMPIDLIKQAYSDYFIDGANIEFNRTLFHFLRNRLRKQKDDFALAHCITLFETHPEETMPILDYVTDVEAIERTHDTIVNFVHSNEAVYPYQIYEIMNWFYEYAAPTETNLSLARRLAFDVAQPPYLRATCRRTLADYGTSADLERLETSYSETSNPLEQCEIICCLYRLESSRRNSFIGRCERDSDLHSRACKLVKSGHFARHHP